MIEVKVSLNKIKGKTWQQLAEEHGLSLETKTQTWKELVESNISGYLGTDDEILKIDYVSSLQRISQMEITKDDEDVLEFLAVYDNTTDWRRLVTLYLTQGE